MEQSVGRGASGDPAAGRLYGPVFGADLPAGLAGGPPALAGPEPAAAAALGALGFEVPPWQPPLGAQVE
eukprot:14976233-Alexandrium_andersonii.AAC.1